VGALLILTVVKDSVCAGSQWASGPVAVCSGKWPSQVSAHVQRRHHVVCPQRRFSLSSPFLHFPTKTPPNKKHHFLTSRLTCHRFLLLPPQLLLVKTSNCRSTPLHFAPSALFSPSFHCYTKPNASAPCRPDESHLQPLTSPEHHLTSFQFFQRSIVHIRHSQSCRTYSLLRCLSLIPSATCTWRACILFYIVNNGAWMKFRAFCTSMSEPQYFPKHCRQHLNCRPTQSVSARYCCFSRVYQLSHHC
jgi:hypothetical protein